MTDPANGPGSTPTVVRPALDYTQTATPQRPPEALAFTAAVCSLCGLVFLPLGPVGLLLALVALVTFKRRTPSGRTMTVVALVAGVVSTAGLVAVVYYVLKHVPV